jgi:hypothetical protein
MNVKVGKSEGATSFAGVEEKKISRADKIR